ncbi:MAG: cupin domain-containing protein [Thermodesulfobacteriota bacterium]
MNVSKISEATAFEVKPGRKRRILHTDHLMMVAFDFADGPAVAPDPPHTHPHDQVTYVAEGVVMFFIGEESCRLVPGDMVAVPPDRPHTIQLLTPTARLIDTFTPLRQEFL